MSETHGQTTGHVSGQLGQRSDNLRQDQDTVSDTRTDKQTNLGQPKTTVLPWYIVVLIAVIVVVALSMTWYSMMDMGTDYLSLPVLLAFGVSLAFDGGAIFLSWLSIQYAKTQDSGFWSEIGAFGFIAVGVYIVVQHALLEQYPTAGVVMFAAAPVIVGVILKATLSYLSRQTRRQAGRVTDKLPSVGWMTWVRYRRQSWRLMSVAMQERLVRAADRLVLSEDRHGIFDRTNGQTPRTVVSDTEGQRLDMSGDVSGQEDKARTRVLDKPDNVLELSGHSDKPALTSSDTMSLPVWLPNEPTMSLGTLARTCLDNGVTNLEDVYRLSVTLKGQDVNKASLSRTLAREKTKLS